MALSIKLPSLSRDYFIFSAIVMMGVLLGSLWFVFSLYQTQLRGRDYHYSLEAEHLAKALTESFDYISNMAEFIGKRIAEHTPENDLDYISTIFQTKFSPKVKEQDSFLWSILGWIDTHENVVVSNREGILKTPNHIDNRTYMVKVPQTPWKLFLDDPNIGTTSREYVIPGGMGVANSEGKYIGTVTMGLNVFRLTSILEQAVTTDGASFIVLTKDGKLVTKSTDSEDIKNKDFFIGKLDYLFSLERDTGKLKKDITIGNVTYRYFRLVYPYSYIILVGENQYITNRQLWESVLPFIIPTGAMGVFFIVLLYFFRKKVVNPMVELSNAAIEIANHNYAVKIPHGNSFEAHNLSKSLLRIKRSFTREQRLKQALHHAMIEADTAKEEAIRANKAKTEFLANMSHELRTPLNATIGFSEMMIAGVYGPLNAKNMEYVHDIHASSLHLLQLITDLLDISKAESGKFELREENVDILALVTNAKRLVQARADTNKLAVIVDADAGLPLLYCDKLRIKQALVNLLSNAVKYTLEGGIITIGCHYKEGQFILSVADTGIGIADIEKALSEFGTIDNAVNRRVESTGLGLPLAKRLFELHDAAFAIESAPGKGTTITVAFPKVRVVLQAGTSRVEG